MAGKSHMALSPNIRVAGSSRFQEKVERSLTQIDRTETGRKLFSGITQTGRRVTIVPSPDGKNHSRPLDREDAYEDPVDGARGRGTSATVLFNPDKTTLGSGTEAWQRRPAYVGLFHELVHAWDYTHGKLAPGRTNGIKNDELAAVGLPYDDDGDPSTPKVLPNRVTENDLRREVGLPLRKAYAHSSSYF
jgi:hypothetical protein